MRRSNFIIGLGLSAVLHGALLYLLLGSAPPAPPPPASPPPVTPLQISSAQEKLPLDPVPVAAQPPVAPEPTTIVPEPATMALFLLGCGGALISRRRRS